MPLFAVDVPSNVFDAIARSDAWVNDDEIWRTQVLALVPAAQVDYANQVRDAVIKRRSPDGTEVIIMLFSVREERVVLLRLKQ